MKTSKNVVSFWSFPLIASAIKEAFIKLNPLSLWKNPVIFVTEIGAFITTIELIRSSESFFFTLQISLWLWFTVLLRILQKLLPKVGERLKPKV
ncbi:hypothetical protein kam1_36 [Methylacidiphilum kamchatkense Kam1]|uniref:Uncharacterized protein n=1 Tax=Methylacidiphilum kamchatkense Kam1 TaxID=1202785 RepID=A0A516TJ76_9BACT|nr:hypothetical protein [Methylacidiphilum kamchatkense]QDQ41297.1 hypothetical protein kam1_36 [Methylacidiphilum kamchatkense Kam1]